MALAASGLRYLLVFTFLGASLPKFAAHADFKLAVANYQLVPSRLVSVFARAIPVVELSLGVVLLVRTEVGFASLVAAGLLLGFAAAVSINLARGRIIDCGCSGAASPQRIGWPLVGRDLVLAAIALYVGAVNPPLAAAWPVAAHLPSWSNEVALLLAAGLTVCGKAFAGEVLRLLRASKAFAEATSATDAA